MKLPKFNLKFEWLFCVAFLITLIGCTEENQKAISSAVESVKNSSPLKKVEEVVAQATSGGKITVGETIDFASCYVSLINLGERGNILKIQSYPESSPPSYPAFYIHAQVPSQSIESAIGQEIEAQFFLQASDDAPVFHHPPDQLITILLESSDQSINAKIIDGEVETASGESHPISGDLDCVEAN